MLAPIYANDNGVEWGAPFPTASSEVLHTKRHRTSRDIVVRCTSGGGWITEPELPEAITNAAAK